MADNNQFEALKLEAANKTKNRSSVPPPFYKKPLIKTHYYQFEAQEKEVKVIKERFYQPSQF